MTMTYHARLRLEASVPEKPIVDPFLEIFVEFEVLCPKCGPRRKNNKKNGFNKNHSKKPQLFNCKRCKSSFYAHTSWLFSQLSDVLLERIVTDLFEELLTPKAAAAVHNISPSLISTIRHHFREALEQKLAILAKEGHNCNKKLFFKDSHQLNRLYNDHIKWQFLIDFVHVT